MNPMFRRGGWSEVWTLLKRYSYLGYKGVWLTATSRYPIGTNIFDRDWDLLVVLDACRVDALKEVAGEYDFLMEINSIFSVASDSREWMAQTFTTEHVDEIAQTAYVSANAFSARVIEDRTLPGGPAPTNWDVVSPEKFLLLDQAWEQQPDHPYKHMLSEHLTDRAITVGREYDPGRQIVHYLQPHKPYIANAIKEDRDLKYYEKQPFEAYRTGKVDKSTIWNAYLDDLRRGLDNVERLLENINAARAVITADHGEAFGEWGWYGHLSGNIHPVVRRAPWAVTTATDEGKYEPSFDYENTRSRDMDEQLRDLGYRV